jgi:hypothetical protein
MPVPTASMSCGSTRRSTCRHAPAAATAIGRPRAGETPPRIPTSGCAPRVHRSACRRLPPEEAGGAPRRALWCRRPTCRSCMDEAPPAAAAPRLTSCNAPRRVATTLEHCGQTATRTRTSAASNSGRASLTRGSQISARQAPRQRDARTPAPPRAERFRLGLENQQREDEANRQRRGENGAPEHPSKSPCQRCDGRSEPSSGNQPQRRPSTAGPDHNPLFQPIIDHRAEPPGHGASLRLGIYGRRTQTPAHDPSIPAIGWDFARVGDARASRYDSRCAGERPEPRR